MGVIPTIEVQGGMVAWSMILEAKSRQHELKKKLTQEQVAQLLGVSRQTISNWENEKSYPDIISVIKMSECYNIFPCVMIDA